MLLDYLDFKQTLHFLFKYIPLSLGNVSSSVLQRVSLYQLPIQSVLSVYIKARLTGCLGLEGLARNTTMWHSSNAWIDMQQASQKTMMCCVHRMIHIR